MLTLSFEPALDHPDLVSNTVTTLLKNWPGQTPVHEIEAAQIDPQYAGGSDFLTHYSIEHGANCVIVIGTRGDTSQIAACLAPVGSRLNLNSTVRKALSARRVSLAPLDLILEKTQMEYGSITVIGLPTDWKILIDERCILPKQLVIGSGLLKSKIRLPGKALAELPNAEIIQNLAN